MTFRQRPGSDRPSSGTAQGFDLDGELVRLRGEQERQEGRRNSSTLPKGEGMGVAPLAMNAGDRLEEHSAPEPIALIVREGRTRFAAVGGPERVLTRDARVRHAVEALSDAFRPLNIGGQGATAP